ncbi:MAG TPA: inorganic phosphate transporter [Nitrospiria bacterium]|nr:inorganic phosphate transporter [Nitrospiria bacterium]
MTSVLLIAVLILAFANGANDNAKGVATLRGSGLASYTTTIFWGTICTLIGSLLSVRFGTKLIPLFNGRGLLPGEAIGQPNLLLAVTLASAATVLLASRIGVPISTTHALTGALIGGGAAAVGTGQLRLELLGKAVVLPLLLSPLISLCLTLILFSLISPFRRIVGTCVCLVRREQAVISGQTLMHIQDIRPVDLVIGTTSECQRISTDSRTTPLNLIHWVSAGTMSFARGMNDTPKITALLIGAGSVLPEMEAVFGVALAMALGGIVGARRISKTLSEKITPMDPVQGASANLITSILVSLASRHGMPVSTTHVACGSLFGIGCLHKSKTDWKQVLNIILAWGITLPAAVMLGGFFYLLLKILL